MYSHGQGRNQRPEIKGIKTDYGVLSVPRGRRNQRPEIKGIKTGGFLETRAAAGVGTRDPK